MKNRNPQELIEYNQNNNKLVNKGNKITYKVKEQTTYATLSGLGSF